MEEPAEAQTIRRLLEKASEIAGADEVPYSFVDLSKTYDLSEARFSDLVAEISQLVHSSDQWVRLEVVEALCAYRPIPGYEWVAVEGWRNAPAAHIHICATALMRTCDTKERITSQLVTMVAAPLFADEPQRQDFDDELPYRESLEDVEYAARRAYEVLLYFDYVLKNEPIPRDFWMKRDLIYCPDLPVDWRVVATVLYTTCCVQMGRD